MTIDTEQFVMDLNDFRMQMHRDSAEFNRQLFIREEIRRATAEMAQASAEDILRLADCMQRAIGRQTPALDSSGADQMASRFAPSGSDELRGVAWDSGYGVSH